MSYQDKYLKYKNKYLQYKMTNVYNNQTGGGKPTIVNYNHINLFTDIQMEQLLNPIHGFFLCESGYINNNYILKKSELLDTDTSKKIVKLSKRIGQTAEIYPNNKIKDQMNIGTTTAAYKIGRYIALLYILYTRDTFRNNFYLKINEIKYNKEVSVSIQEKAFIQFLDEITTAASDIGAHIKMTKIKLMDFHLVLYCLWWVLNNDAGIEQYYLGITNVFNTFNTFNIFNEESKYFTNKIEFNFSPKENPCFEEILIKIAQIDFNIYAQEQSKYFCDTLTLTNPVYPDCGEVTARNLVNLICVDSATQMFNLDVLIKLGAIQELIDYYTVFNNFSLQSSLTPLLIYGTFLNARDAWSKLIIFYANTNINFLNSCSIAGSIYGYELNAGMAKDRTKTNFFQLICNLLPGVKKWDDIPNMTIVDNTIKGIGNGIKGIVITKEPHEYVINCYERHYNMELKKSPSRIKYDITQYNEQHQFMINVLSRNYSILSTYNFLWFSYNGDFLVEHMNTGTYDILIKEQLFILSLTDQYIEDVRSRILIDVTLFTPIFDIFKKFPNKIEIFNQYTYLCNDFEFIRNLPLTKLNCRMTDKTITSIDLTPLSNITSIGFNFLYGCTGLTEINLSKLSNITSIGYNFLYGCTGLKTIDLSKLSNITSIGGSFLSECKGLTEINLSKLSNVTSIDNSFLYECRGLKTIDLSGLSKLTSIGEYFLSECSGLKEIDLSGLSKLTTIGEYFLSGCSGLITIDFLDLSEVTSIGNNFLSECKELTTIDLLGLSKVTSIGDNFLSGCINLKTILFGEYQESNPIFINSIGPDKLKTLTIEKSVPMLNYII
jgi:hypothetical protein